MTPAERKLLIELGKYKVCTLYITGYGSQADKLKALVHTVEFAHGYPRTKKKG